MRAMTLAEMLVDSWRRQSRCLSNLFDLITPELAGAKPSEDGWSLSEQYCHLIECRVSWLKHASGGKEIPGDVCLYTEQGGKWHASTDLALIREQLNLSEDAVAAWLTKTLKDGAGAAGPYDNPVLYLQHMIWHDGYHAGLIILALRRAGAEPTDEWDETNIWSNWRTEPAWE